MRGKISFIVLLLGLSAAVLVTCDIYDDEYNTNVAELYVEAKEATDVTMNSASVIVNFSADNKRGIDNVGIAYSTEAKNLSADLIYTRGSSAPSATFGVFETSVCSNCPGDEIFEAKFKTLKGNTAYFYKPYIKINSNSDSYKYFTNGYFVPPGKPKTFTTAPSSVTPPPGDNTFMDPRDGKVYKIKDVGGGKIWFMEDLAYQKTTKRYTWSEACIACPSGWHLPDISEWANLASSTVWTAATRSDFIETYGITTVPYWWSSTPYPSSAIYAYDYYLVGIQLSRKNSDRSYMYAVRCIKN